MKVKTNNGVLIERIKEHVLSIFQLHESSAFAYHNSTHTQKVVDAALKIAKHYTLSEDDFFVLMAAAWFHDIGYFEDATRHEEKSSIQARKFLESENVEEEIILRITSCIEATRMPQQPKNLVEQILCDADLYHLGTEDFDLSDKKMRKECKFLYNKDFSKKEWWAKAIQFLEAHHYHTEYARQILNLGKRKNMEILEAKANETGEDDFLAILEAKGNEKMKKEKKKKKPKRGIETMFRIASNNHQRLSDMADNKANIMITVNSIILSVLLSVLLRKLEENPSLTIPVILLLAVNLVTIIFSILATRPHISSGLYTQKEVDDKKVNLLFFGNFYRMNLGDYTQNVLQMMDDGDYLYKSLIKDVYSQGVVLGRKYKLLRSAYNVFMFGIIVSVIAFLIGTLFS